MSGSNAKRHRRDGLGENARPATQPRWEGGVRANAARNVTARAGSFSAERRHEKPLSRVVLQLECIPYGFLGNFNALSRQSPQM